MHQLTLAEIARGLADKSFSSEELTRALLARIKQLDPQINSFISVTEDLALGQARAADARRAAGETGALLGPHRPQGPVLHQRRTHQLRLEDARQLQGAVRRHRGRQAG